MKSPHKKHFQDREAWRAWLQENHDSAPELWVIYFKKHTKKPTVQYVEAVEEAICFGWIDTKVKTIDAERYMQKYTPRKKNSAWSKLNKERALKMIAQGRMTDAGMAKIEEAKQNGRWDSAYTLNKNVEMPEDLKSALMKDENAWVNFSNFADGYKNDYIRYVVAAKRDDTRQRRIEKVVQRSVNNEKPGMM
ncbi:hypothetical protein CEE37_15050 [candidate division LCP-89 bacterium B3_LCP]|uniref:Bacteriocin-protection protein n=1 Tax=candidate division LCP-89 bacterium B3_LCP TaxID=2012998 RepID=A0A532UNS9_UNCL8|nr:MAG: hypothetical protein CEE37_15050 [candidate division LCP-89 bacterium B3_LCP]